MARDPSLGKMLVASMVLHLALMLTFSVTGLFRSKRYTAPNPYFVDLVPAASRKRAGPPGGSLLEKAKPETPKKIADQEKSPPRPAPEKKAPPKSDMSALSPDRKKETKPREQTEMEDTSRVKEEIRRIERVKELERIARLRGIVGSNRGEGPSSPGIPGGSGRPGASPEKMAVYYGIIRLQVMDSWVLQGDRFGENLETEVLINIGKEGGILKQTIERSSGNPEFDRSVMRAIAKASPFPPPPEDVDTEIQFKFTPKEDIR